MWVCLSAQRHGDVADAAAGVLHSRIPQQCLYTNALPVMGPR
jgi:hypothetical protein